MQSIFNEKLKAFLHDPFDKPLILLSGKSHKDRAEELARIVNVGYAASSASDHIAAAMERAFLPKNAGRQKELQVIFGQEGEVRHPLSALPWQQIKLSKDDVGKLAKALEKTLKIIAERNAEPKNLFFDLWRNILPETKAQVEDTRLQRILDLMVADTRIPDHHIFDHLQTAATFAQSIYQDNNLITKATLVLFSVGPVQNFIAQARKTQDLYWSSYLLSYFSFLVILNLIDLYGPDCVVYPDLHGQPFVDWWLRNELQLKVSPGGTDLGLPAIPNRCMAIIPENDPENLETIFKLMEKKVRDEFKKISQHSLESMKIKKPLYFDEQIDSFLEIYGVALPFESDQPAQKGIARMIENFHLFFNKEKLSEFKELLGWAEKNSEFPPNIGVTYGLAYEYLDKVLGVRKNSRNFRQLCEKGRKCSVCGERNVKIYFRQSNEQSKSIPKKFFLADNELIILDHLPENNPLVISPGEGLCAVCFTKRLAGSYFKEKFKVKEDFPSTAEIALLHLQKDNEVKNLINNFKEEFKNKYDPQLLYEENLTESYFRKNGLEELLGKLDELKKKRKEIEEAAKKKGLNLTRYYALLMFDGDNMGKWVSGDIAPGFAEVYHSRVWNNLPVVFKRKLEGKKRPLTPALHRFISKSLKNYSLKFVRKIIEEKGLGRVIYAGGDDLIAFVNLTYLFEAMVRLRAAFSGHCDINLEVDFTKEASGFVDHVGGVLTLLGYKASLSGGVVIAHYKSPLSYVLNVLRQAEEKAKESNEQKNSYCMMVIRRGGELSEAVLKWMVPDERHKEGSVGLLKDILRARQENEVSSRFAEKLRIGLSRLGLREGYLEMMKTEITRILLRSVEENQKDKRVVANRLSERIINLKDYCPKAAGWLENVFSVLDIVNFLGREIAKE